ncbi:MAG TPA: hemerythrin domain-containing protein [bacterium]|nr:hemerythrin domain-containing protein [bacterium]
MSLPDLHEPLQKLASREPGLPKLLHHHGIDLRFAGNLTLTEACAMHGIDLGSLVQELEEMDRDSHFLPQEVLEQFGVPEMVGYILATHHSFLRRELHRLEGLLGEAGRADGAALPALRDLLGPFQDFRASLEWHMREEEENLFPYFIDLAASPAAGLAQIDEMESLVRVFEAEEERVMVDLNELRRISGGYRLPGDAGAATRDLFHDLVRMETELHRHIHDENFILYPKVRAHCAGQGPRKPSLADLPWGTLGKK